MALGAAMVDRARIVRKARSPVRIEGRSQYSDTYSAWFRCRLELRTDNEGNDPPGSQKRSTRSPNLMFLTTDTEGAPVEVRFSDRLEIRPTGGLVSAMWEVTAEPGPIRKKRRVIGYEVTLRRVVEHEPAGVG